ncbi:MAG: hypothetical protein KAT70_07805, partial [Thermoplasmata archaeon]|nr:hypothetical protein [Thermoplasmata archaeon]
DDGTEDDGTGDDVDDGTGDDGTEDDGTGDDGTEDDGTGDDVDDGTPDDGDPGDEPVDDGTGDEGDDDEEPVDDDEPADDNTSAEPGEPGDEGPDELEYVDLGYRSGWISSPDAVEEGECEHTEVYTLAHRPCIVFFTVTINDSDAAHAETDEGSDPDSAKVTVSDGANITQSQNIYTTTGTYTFEFGVNRSEGADLGTQWTIEIKGMEFGGGKGAYNVPAPAEARPVPFVYVDQGLAWAIEGGYWYDDEPVDDEPAEPSGPGYGDLGYCNGWIASPDSVDEWEEKEHIESYNLGHIPYKVFFTVTINDSDAAHAETDEGSDPDTAKVTVSDGGSSYLSQIISTTAGTYTFEFGLNESKEVVFGTSWTVEIEGQEFGGDKETSPGPLGIANIYRYIDQGLAWSIEGGYWYG